MIYLIFILLCLGMALLHLPFYLLSEWVHYKACSKWKAASLIIIPTSPTYKPTKRRARISRMEKRYRNTQLLRILDS